MDFTRSTTDPAALAELGERLARHRLRANLTQADLARRAGISKRTLIRIESGESAQLTHLIRLLRALDLLGNLDALVPLPRPSPLELLRAKPTERRRASPSAKSPPRRSDWTWGDEPHQHGGAP
jgi:transcriptional regulator with XRE-family HTH domain